jgi:uncharacterized protein (DUF697 family)
MELDAEKEIKYEKDAPKMAQMLDWAYDQAVNGMPLLSSAAEQAEKYAKKYPNDPGRQANALIRRQIAMAAASGFVTGLGGFLTIPVMMPANIVSVLYVQLKMIASIAHIYGHYVKDDHVRAMAYMCLIGDVANKSTESFGLKLGEKITISLIKNLGWDTIKAINKKVAYALLAKLGEKGLVGANKLIPLVGGAISASFDAVSTSAVGKMAKKVFSE